MTDKKLLCSYPFNSLFLSGNSEIKFCCASRSVLGDANTTTVEDAMQSTVAKEIREHMLTGSWHENCIVCKNIEDIGGKSTRTQETFNLQLDNLTTDDFTLEFVDLRWNNTCNLTCNYCVPEFSNKWAKIKEVPITRIHKDNEYKILDFIERHKETVTKVMLLGGEPLLHKQNLILTDIVPNAFYYILTNLSLENLPEYSNVQKFLTLPHFDWGVSFDCIGSKFEYVRHGANWDVFLKNIKYMQSKANENGFDFSAHPLYGLYSAYNLVEYYDFVHEHNLFTSGIWWQSLLHTSGGAINNMTKKMKEEAIIEAERCITKYPDASGISMITELKNQLIVDLDKPDNKIYMQSVIGEFDKLETQWLLDKKHSFKELWPQVYQWILEGTT